MGISPSKSLIISGVVGATLALATLTFLGSSVPEGVWNHPVPGTIHVAFAVLLVVVHLLTAHGFWGLSRLQGAGRLVLFLVTPANIAGAVVLRMVALAVWSFVFVWMGRGLADAAGSPAPRLTPPTPEVQP